MSSETAIRVRNLGKHYQIYERPQHRLLQMLWRGRRRYFREFRALDDVSFDVLRGETVGIIGRNGAGKSTLLQLICGTLAPSAGSVEVNGRIAALLELGAGFNPEFTGRENAHINAAILGLSPQEIEARYDGIAGFADIGDFIDQPVKTYSSGMYVRLAFSVAIHVSPDILIVDEALSVGDAFFQAKCMSRIRQMLDDGVTLLFISHDIAAVKALCRRVLWLEQGRIRAQGPTAEIARLYSHDWVTQANLLHGIESVQAEPEADEARSGNGDARLGAIRWHTPEGPAEHRPVAYGEALTIEAEVTLHAPCSRLVVSYHIKDRHQQHVLGGHSHDHPLVYGRRWEAGERFRVAFTLPVSLHEGSYTLTMLVASIGDVARYTDAVFLDWVEDAAMMRVAARERFPLSDMVEPDHEVDVAVLEAAASPGVAGAR